MLGKRCLACRESEAISIHCGQSQTEAGCAGGGGMRGSQDSEKTDPCPQCHGEVEEMDGRPQKKHQVIQTLTSGQLAQSSTPEWQCQEPRMGTVEECLTSRKVLYLE